MACVTAPGFRDAYAQFVAGGWPALGADAAFGGQPVPRVLVSAVGEFWGSANLAFKLGPMLTHGAVHALELCGSPAQKQMYLPKMVSGEWTGTMVLTEPQAGSDLGQVRTRAAPEGDHYRLFGPEDLHHLGRSRPHRQHHPHGARPHRRRARRRQGHLAVHRAEVPGRTPMAPSGSATRCAACRSSTSSASTRVPPAYSPSARRTAPSPTSWAQPGRGLEYMFIMMNSARLSVGERGLCGRRARLPARRGVGPHARAGQAAGGGGRRVRCRSSTIRT